MTEQSWFQSLLEQETSKRRCGLALAFAKFEKDSDYVRDVKIAMGNEDVSAAVISRVLAISDIFVSEGSIRRCRRNLCPCWKIVPEDQTGAI